MSIEQFLKCLDMGVVSERALAVRKEARNLLDHHYKGDQHSAFEAALTLVLDDPSPRVRAALAETLSLSGSAPEHLVAALAVDQPEVASTILARSPLVRDIDLIDRISMVDEKTQTLIANRVHVSKGLAAAIAEHGCALACMTLLSNETADIAPVTFSRIADRFSDNATMRGILASDPRVPATTRHMLVIAASSALENAPLIMNILGECRAKAVAEEAAKHSTISLIETTDLEEYPALIAYLRDQGRLTSGFIIRVLACGKVDFFGDILVGLCGQSHKRVCSILVDGNDVAVRALFKRCELANSIHEVLLTGLRSWRAIARGTRDAGPQAVTWDMLCEAQKLDTSHVPANDDLAALLKGLYVDMTRINARAYAREMAQEISQAQQEALAAAQQLEVIITEEDILEGLIDEEGNLFDDNAMDELAAGIEDILADEPDMPEIAAEEDDSESVHFDDLFNFDINISDRVAA